MTTEERLENLERELTRVKRNNRLLMLGTVILAVLVLGWYPLTQQWVSSAYAQGTPTGPKIMRANQFILEDENGKPRASLVLVKDGPVLSLDDENGKTRATLALSKIGPVLREILWQGGKIALHCRDGRDRTGMIAARFFRQPTPVPAAAPQANSPPTPPA